MKATTTTSRVIKHSLKKISFHVGGQYLYSRDKVRGITLYIIQYRSSLVSLFKVMISGAITLYIRNTIAFV